MKYRLKISAFCLLVLSLFLLSACGGASRGAGDIFDRFSPEMTSEDVQTLMGEPDGVIYGKNLLYTDIEFYGLTGNLHVNFNDAGTVYEVEWSYYTGENTVGDYTKETQAIYDHFTSKFGESQQQYNIYHWYISENQGPAGSPCYVLNLHQRNMIRVYVNFEV